MTDMNPSLLAEYTRVMREQGVLMFECGSLKIVLGPLPVTGKDLTHTKDDYNTLLYAASEGISDES